MTRLVNKIVKFLLVVVAIYLLGIFTMTKVNYKGKPLLFYTNDYYVWKGGDTYEKFKTADSLSSKDVLIIGSSRAYRGYSPEIFKEHGLTAWNLGSHAQSLDNSFVILQNVLKHVKPKVVLLDIGRGVFDSEDMESSIDLITNASDNSIKLDILKRERDVRLFNVYLASWINQSTPSTYENQDYVGAGFVTKPDSLNEDWRSRLKYLTEEKKNVENVKDYGILHKIIKTCKENDQKLILVHSPVSDFFSKKAQDIFLEEVSEIANLNNVPLLDLQYVDGINSTDHFYDNAHLNKAGVSIFNQRLLGEIKDIIE